MYHDDNASEGPRGTFEIYRAEADSLYKQGEYRKAIESYTIALEITPGERNCLVARSKCHLQLGDMQGALRDAESSLEEDKDYHKGIYQKAQALYYQGEFELSLVFYHRGHKLRPELQEFRLGIQKGQEAIDNSVGSKSTNKMFPRNYQSTLKIWRKPKPKPKFLCKAQRTSSWCLETICTNLSPSVSKSSTDPKTDSKTKTNSKTVSFAGSTLARSTPATKKPPPAQGKGAETVKLTTEGDLSYFEQLQDEKKIRRKAPPAFGRQEVQQKSAQRQSVGSEKTIKQLLGELYGDRQYLEKLLKETDPNSEMGKTISTLVNDGLSYLDTRSDFWRQQKPMYARKQERMMQRRKREVASSKLAPNDYILKELERIDQAQVDGRYQEALKRAQKCLSTVQGFSEDDVPNKTEVVANLHSCVGNAYLELGEYNKALSSHETDLNIGESNDMLEAVSRGLDNIGRVHARRSEFAKAIQIWERKLPMSKSPLESTWLYHEIGRCYLELGEFADAQKFGEQSETAAIEAEDQMWQLQASVLTAQAEVKLGQYQGGCATFEKALELAKSQGDKSAEAAISKAIIDINKKIVEEANNQPEPTTTNDNENAPTESNEGQKGQDEPDIKKDTEPSKAESVKDTQSEGGKGQDADAKSETPAVKTDDDKTDETQDKEKNETSEES